MTARRSSRSSAGSSSVSIRPGFTLLLAALTTGCATFVRFVSPDKASFVSEPAGAEVTMDTGETCKTPCTIEFKEVKKQTAHARLKDGRTKDVEMKRRIAYGFWWNFVTYYPVGMLLDLATGAMWAYPNKVVDFDFDETPDKDDDAEPEPTKKTAPPARTPPPPPPPPADEGEADSAPAPEIDPLSPQALPRTPEVLHVIESYPEGYMATEVRYYYGEQDRMAERKAIARIYRILVEMQMAGERPDLDEAVRRDRFRNLP